MYADDHEEVTHVAGHRYYRLRRDGDNLLYERSMDGAAFEVLSVQGPWGIAWPTHALRPAIFVMGVATYAGQFISGGEPYPYSVPIGFTGVEMHYEPAYSTPSLASARWNTQRYDLVGEQTAQTGRFSPVAR